MMRRDNDPLVGELLSAALQLRIAQDVARGMECLTTVLKGLLFFLSSRCAEYILC
jgi:hypothetical protein